MNLSVRSPDELLAAIPHLLGFQPEESIVFLPLRSDLPMARVDLPTTAHDRDLVWGSIREAFCRYATPGSAVAIVCFTGDRLTAELASDGLSTKLETIGINPRLRLWADQEHWCDLDTGESGVQTEDARERVAALTVFNGRVQPAVNRDSLAASLIGDREPIAQILPAARAASAATDLQAEGVWAVSRLRQFHVDGNRLGDVEAARILVAMETIPIRDELWGDINRKNVSSHVALWTDLTRRAPHEVRAAPASMLGFASWLNGDGARAWCALDQVPTDKPYSMSTIVATALQAGLHPREWEQHRTRMRETTAEPAGVLTQPPRHGAGERPDLGM